MSRRARRLVIALVFTAALAGCGDDTTTAEGEADRSSPSAGGGAERITIGDKEALIWGDGAYGVVLAHGAAFDAASWEEQATQIADRGMTALAVESISLDSIRDAVTYLEDERGSSDVALVGGSAGADAIVDLVASDTDLSDQLILLSPNRGSARLGDQPKLFIASEDEPVADVSIEMAEENPGEHNEALLLPGAAHAQNIFDSDQADGATEALLDRLDQFADI